MKEYSSEEIQEISSSFRNVARRLSQTDYSQCDANLKRFFNLIESEDAIADFIKVNNTKRYDIKEYISKREFLDPFEISPIMEEEISLEYQLLKYAIDNFNGDFTRLYGTQWYTSTKSTVNDEMRKFIGHVIDPLIDYIADYLRKCFEKAEKRENKENPNYGVINATNSTVVVANKVDGDVSNTVSINEDTKQNAMSIIESLKEIIQESVSSNQEDALELLRQIESDIQNNTKPKKGFLVALKGLCGDMANAVTIITGLISLFGYIR